MLGWIVFWIGALADAWTTDHGLDLPGTREANPLARWLLETFEPRFGDATVYLVKLAIGWGMWMVDAPAVVLWVLGLAQVGSAYWNWTVIRKIRQR